jgi:hypothetical protein
MGFYNRDEKCLQRGTDWVFKYSSLRFIFKGLKQHVNGMPHNRLPRVMKHYSPTGMKESWEIFEEVSGYVRPERVNKWPNSVTDM